MRTCDKSMEFLVGSELSVGTLKSIADSVNEDGPSRMPGYCCMVRLEVLMKQSRAAMLSHTMKYLSVKYRTSRQIHTSLGTMYVF